MNKDTLADTPQMTLLKTWADDYPRHWKNIAHYKRSASLSVFTYTVLGLFLGALFPGLVRIGFYILKPTLLSWSTSEINRVGNWFKPNFLDFLDSLFTMIFWFCVLLGILIGWAKGVSKKHQNIFLSEDLELKMLQTLSLFKILEAQNSSEASSLSSVTPKRAPRGLDF